MKMKHKISTVIILGILSVFAFSQELPDVLAPFYSYDLDNQHFSSPTGYTYPVRISSLDKGGPVSTAIGNATVASGQMVPEFTVNPANLGMTKFNSLQVNGLFTNYNGINKNSLGGLSYIISVPVYTGALNFAAGVNKTKDFSLYYQDDDILQRSSGGIYNWHFNGAMEVQEDIFVGAEVSLLSGERNNDLDFKANTDGYIEENSYFGAGAKIGLTYHPISILNLGVSIDLPTSIENEYSLRTYQDASSANVEYSMTSPAILRAGFAITLKIVDLYYSYDYTNWQDLKVRSSGNNGLLQTRVDEINREITNNLSAVGSHHIGMALHVPMLPLHFYFGYQYLPDTYQGLSAFSLSNLVPNEIQDRFKSSTSWGASFFIKNGLSISASFETYHLFYDGEAEKAKTSNLSMSYFF